MNLKLPLCILLKLSIGMIKRLFGENAVKMLKGQAASPYGHRILTKQNETRWIIETVISINYEGRKAVLGYFMDNTNCVHTQEALGISEDKFTKAFRSSPDWFVISTLEGFYVDVNEAFLRTTGYTREEIVGRSAIDAGIWVHPHERAEMVKILSEKGKVRNLEVEFRMKSGEIRQMLWSAEAIDYGDEKCLIAATRDITDRNRAPKRTAEPGKARRGSGDRRGHMSRNQSTPAIYLSGSQ